MQIEEEKAKYRRSLEDKTEGFFIDEARRNRGMVKKVVNLIHDNKETVRTWAVVYVMTIQTVTLAVTLAIHFGAL